MINVFTSANYIGNLFTSEQNNNKFIFNYRSSIEKKDAVSLTMPIAAEQYEFWNGLHPIFEMNLPE